VKYKFYEQNLPTVDLKGQRWADIKQYTKEIAWVCKNTGRDFNKFKVDDVTFGYEPVMFYEGKYAGYLDQLFYNYFDVDDWEGYWGFDN